MLQSVLLTEVSNKYVSAFLLFKLNTILIHLFTEPSLAS